MQYRISTTLKFTLFFWISLFAQDEDKTESPYFLVTSSNNVESLPLQSTSADATISGVIADIHIQQVYQNRGNLPIEAVYVFPSSSQAAVYHMEMKIGKRIIKAEIKEKQAARQAYEVAKEEGKHASLLEQERPNIFTMNVANIQPGELIQVSLKYTENIVPKDGIYSFVYPTVVGPRYQGESQGENGLPVCNQSVSENGPAYSYSMDVSIDAGMPLQDVQCTSHKVEISYLGLGTAKISLAEEEHSGGNRDFILEYQLSGNELSSGLLTHDGKDENFFMLTVQPPKEVHDYDVPKQEFVFVIDVSGSMYGFPLDVSKTLMRNLLTNLREDDLFNVVLFAGNASTYATESVKVSPEEIDKAIRWIENAEGGGGTRLINALNKVFSLPNSNQGLSRSIVIISDGYISVEKEVFDLIKQNKEGFNVYAFGIGSSPNRYLMEGIAHVGNTAPLIITKPQEAASKANQYRKMISQPVLTDIKIDWGDLQPYDLQPSQINDVLGLQPIAIVGKYKGDPNSIIRIEGVHGKEPFYTSIERTKNEHGSKEALKYLWARKKIQLLDDYNIIDQDSIRIKEVTSLGLKYNLLTKYTSFIAIDYEVSFAQDGTTVYQPLPLPQGVSKRALSAQNISTMGAEMTIANSPKEKHLFDYKILINSNTISSIEEKMLKLELKSKFKQVEKILSQAGHAKIELKFKINQHGIIINLVEVKNQVPAYVFNKIIKEINSLRFRIRGEQNIEVQVNLLQTSK